MEKGRVMLGIETAIDKLDPDPVAAQSDITPSIEDCLAQDLTTDDFARFGLDPEQALSSSNGKAMRYCTGLELSRMLTEGPPRFDAIKLALAVLEANPLIAVRGRLGHLLVCACRAATPPRDDPRYLDLVPIREKLWRLSAAALDHQRTDLDMAGQTLGHDGARRRNALAAIESGIPLAPGDPYRAFWHGRNVVAQARAILSPPGVLYVTTSSQLYATFDARHGPEMVPAAQNGNPIFLSGTADTFVSETVFVIVPDGASVRLCHFAERDVEHWHGREFGTPLAAIYFAGVEHGIPRHAWRDSHFEPLLDS